MNEIGQVIGRVTGVIGRQRSAPLIINGTAAPTPGITDILSGFDTFGIPDPVPPPYHTAKSVLVTILTFYAQYNPATDVQRRQQAREYAEQPFIIQTQLAHPLVLNVTPLPPYDPTIDFRSGQKKDFVNVETSYQTQKPALLILNGSAAPYNPSAEIHPPPVRFVGAVDFWLQPQTPKPLIINGTAFVPPVYNPATDVARAPQARYYVPPEFSVQTQLAQPLIINGKAGGNRMAVTLTLIANQMRTNAAAVATAAAGGLVTNDITNLASILSALALSQDISIPLISIATTPANASTMPIPA